MSTRRLGEIGAAVVGTGFIGAVHVETLRRIGVSVRGVVGSSPERAVEAARTLGVEQAYPSYEAMLADESVDVVHIASPNHLHHGQVMAALAAGKHVVCEKPLALTSAESAELVRVATASGLVHAVQFQLRHYPLNHHLKGSVVAGELGTVRLISGHYLQDWLLNEGDWNWRLDPAVGGPLRTVGDIGSHWLDLVAFVSGLRVESVMADLATFLPTRQEPVGIARTFDSTAAEQTVSRPISTEDCATLLLRFSGGARGALTISQISPGRKNSLRYEVDGSDSAAAWDSERPDELWIGYRDRPNQLLLRDPALMNEEGRSQTRLPGGHAEGFADGFASFQSEVYAVIASGAGPPARPRYATFGDGHEEMLIGDAILESARTGVWVDVRREQGGVA